MLLQQKCNLCKYLCEEVVIDGGSMFGVGFGESVGGADEVVVGDKLVELVPDFARVLHVLPVGVLHNKQQRTLIFYASHM